MVVKFKQKSFCTLDADLIESEAFLSLSGKAALLSLIRFHQKAYKKRLPTKKRGSKELIITNQGQIVFTYSEFKELGLGNDATFNRVLRELTTEKGFIDIAEQGNWYLKQPTKFSISDRWRDYNTPTFKRIEKTRALPKGLGFKKGHRAKDAITHDSEQTITHDSEKPFFQFVSLSPMIVSEDTQNDRINDCII